MRLFPGLTRPLRRQVWPPQTLCARAYANDAKPKPPSQPVTPEFPEPEEHRRSWFWTANRVSNFVVIPAAILYCVFVADYGEDEHVFSPMRRWWQRQRNAFFSLSPEERQLVRENKEDSPDEQKEQISK